MDTSSDEELLLQENLYLKLKLKKQSVFGIHSINLSRKIFGEFHHLYDELRQDEKKFVEYTRMNIGTFDYILSKIKPFLLKQWTNFNKTPIKAAERLIVTLRYLAIGTSFRSLSFSFRMGATTVRSIVIETCEILWIVLQPLHMPMPTEQSFKKVAEEYWERWGFPNCVGSIDGKHIRVKCPTKSGSMFYNYKKYFSIVLQAVADANCKFVTIEVGGFGRQSDGGTFASSALFKMKNSGELNFPKDVELPNTTISMPYVLVADEAYPLLDWVLRPYARRNLTLENEYFNSRLSRARRCVECAFGIINSKWRILWKPIETAPNTAEVTVKAICILHNTMFDLEDIKNHIAEGEQFIKDANTCRPESSKKAGRIIRDTFRSYVCRNRNTTNTGMP